MHNDTKKTGHSIIVYWTFGICHSSFILHSTFSTILPHARCRSGKDITSAMFFASVAIIARRSKPRATPVDGRQSGVHGQARRRLSSGNFVLPSAARQSVGFGVAAAELVGVGQLVVAVGQFDAVDVQLEPFGDRNLFFTFSVLFDRREYEPGPLAWRGSRRESRAHALPKCGWTHSTSSRSSQPSRSFASRPAGRPDVVFHRRSFAVMSHNRPCAGRLPT